MEAEHPARERRRTFGMLGDESAIEGRRKRFRLFLRIVATATQHERRSPEAIVNH